MDNIYFVRNICSLFKAIVLQSFACNGCSLGVFLGVFFVVVVLFCFFLGRMH